MLIDRTLIKKWLRDKRFIVISGLKGSGKSLLAAKILLNLGRDIVSSENLNLPCEKFQIENLFDYSNKVIHIVDMPVYGTSKVEGLSDNLVGFINELEEKKNQLIVEIQDSSLLYPELQTFNAELKCEFLREEKRIWIRYFDFNGLIENHFLVFEDYSRYYRYLPKWRS